MATPTMMMMTKVAKIQKHSATSFNMNILCLLSRLIKAHCTLQFLIVISFVPLVNGYCWQPGKNPGFNGTPKVEQIDIQTVRVSWLGITTQTECADHFLVKYWKISRRSSLEYNMTNLVNNDKFSINIRVTPNVKYVFEVIAKEDKGAFLGVDYNRAKNVEFKTSSNNNVGVTKENPSNGQLKKAGLQFLQLPIGLICIIVVCGVVTVLIAITIVYKLTCYKKSRADFEEYDEDEDVEDTMTDCETKP